jgi:hypothetical protein
LFLAIIKKKKTKKKAKKENKKMKVQNSSKKKKKNLPFNLLSARKLLLFQKEKIASFQYCFSKKIVPVPASKILPFSLVSHII